MERKETKPFSHLLPFFQNEKMLSLRRSEERGRRKRIIGGGGVIHKSREIWDQVEGVKKEGRTRRDRRKRRRKRRKRRTTNGRLGKRMQRRRITRKGRKREGGKGRKDREGEREVMKFRCFQREPTSSPSMEKMSESSASSQTLSLSPLSLSL